MPEWEALKSVWPLFGGLGALWVRLEVALAQTRQQSIENAKEIAKLEAKADAQTLRSNDQAVQLGRIEEQITGLRGDIGRMLKIMERENR
jgi:hypothetical protein